MSQINQNQIAKLVARAQIAFCYAFIVITTIVFLYLCHLYGFDMVDVKDQYGRVQFRMPGVLGATIFFVVGNFISGVGVFSAKRVLKRMQEKE